MKGKPWVALLPLLIWIAISGTGTAAEGTDPSATVKSLLEAVTELSKGEAATNQETVRRITTTFNLVKICEECLRDTWKSSSAVEQDRFVGLFREVLEKVAYPKSAEFFKDTSVEIEEIDAADDRAEVLTVVEHPDEGMIEVGYCLGRTGDQWLIDDILLDGISLVRDLRSQMQKIIKEESYDELKKRIRDKIDD